jgi:protoheme IX farnesyltransferase
MWLTLATFVGYAIVYTLVLKPLTPQNIVIGGASGAMPPVLGWTAVTGNRLRRADPVSDHLCRGRPRTSGRWRSTARDDYAEAGVPMLPVTHGDKFTRSARAAHNRHPDAGNADAFRPHE